jgi:hypothetical protein
VSDLCLALTRGLGRPSAADSGQWDDLRDMLTGQAVVLEAGKSEIVGGCRVVDVWRLGE